MTIVQFRRANDIRGRIYKLQVLINNMKHYGDEIKISDTEIPKNSYDVIFALCEKEISDLEKEFEEL